MIRHAVLLLLLVAVLGSPASAQKNAARGPFAAAKTLTCSFPAYATASLTDTPPRVTSSTQDFSFRIDSIDYRKKNAQIVGGSGSALVALVLTQTGLNVIEQTAIGNLNLTTVFAAGGQGTRFLAVHSRHLGDVNAAPRVSQHYGSCELE